MHGRIDWWQNGAFRSQPPNHKSHMLILRLQALSCLYEPYYAQTEITVLSDAPFFVLWVLRSKRAMKFFGWSGWVIVHFVRDMYLVALHSQPPVMRRVTHLTLGFPVKLGSRTCAAYLTEGAAAFHSNISLLLGHIFSALAVLQAIRDQARPPFFFCVS